MKLFLFNVLLALAWAAVSGSMTFGSLLTGFVIGALVLAVVGQAYGSSHYLQRLRRFVSLMAVFAYELTRSSLQVAWEAVTPNYSMRPAVIAVPIELEKDISITVLANLVSLTPGTLSIDVSSDRKFLYIHAMYAEDAEAVRRSIRDSFEVRVAKVFE